MKHTFRFETSTQVLQDENIAVLRKFLQGRGDRRRRLIGNAIGRALK